MGRPSRCMGSTRVIAGAGTWKRSSARYLYQKCTEHRLTEAGSKGEMKGLRLAEITRLVEQQVHVTYQNSWQPIRNES
ncbi:hypothetical protein DUI87_09956 [Hirundo rustica rustica]|uniref:Uncharacterized protein n=1 Tax=Hirundo rustica rustica TaxID=333673 RepID=A0A3M0KII1_HIRRU|nr:hypothetical protein DUI87_09956 [Hirundo rustica rustica]